MKEYDLTVNKGKYHGRRASIRGESEDYYLLDIEGEKTRMARPKEEIDGRKD